jgi:hypothetical protein
MAKPDLVWTKHHIVKNGQNQTQKTAVQNIAVLANQKTGIRLCEKYAKNHAKEQLTTFDLTNAKRVVLTNTKIVPSGQD